MLATRTFTERKRAERDFLPGHESLLIEQLARATRELHTREAEGLPAETVRTVVRSLRNTLAWTAKHGGPPEPRSLGLMMVVADDGEVELWHRGERVPVESRSLREALEAGAVSPEPGQALLVEPELARHAIEESLVGWSLEELRLRRSKSLLLRALVDLPVRASEASAPIGTSCSRESA